MSDLREVITKELAELLGVDANDVNPDAEFFTMGIDSLDAMRIFMKVQDMSSHALSPTLLFEYDTVNKISGYVDSLDSKAAA